MFSGKKVIGLMIARCDDERSLEIIESINHAAIANNFRLLIYHNCTDLYWNRGREEGDAKIFDLVDYNLIDALVIAADTFKEADGLHRTADKAIEKGLPVIYLGGEHEGAYCFKVDYETGFEAVVSHILDETPGGDVWFLAGIKGEEQSEKRIEVFKRQLAKRGIPFSADMLMYGSYWWQPARKALRKKLRESRAPKSLICANDSMAIAAIIELREFGYHVPEDVKVSGFDGIKESTVSKPTLTTARCNYMMIGTRVVDTICSLLDGSSSVERTQKIEYTLRLGGSCGCVQKEDADALSEALKTANNRYDAFATSEASLFKIAESLLGCESPDMFARVLDSYNLIGTQIVLDKRCFDVTINPLIKLERNAFEGEFLASFVAGDEEGEYPYPFSISKLLPCPENWTTTDYPLIISTLSFAGSVLGYIGFVMPVRPDQYDQVPQYVNMISECVNNYRMTQYIRHLESK